jgi:ATP-dependent protease ClpP protease subunit
MELLYAVKKEQRCCEIMISGAIGREVDGVYVAADIAFINKNNIADKINIHINSEGGKVLNGIQIISAILNSKIPIHTYNDGYAYSMAGFIWLTAKKENRHMAQFARFMIHAPRFVDDQGNLVQPQGEGEKRDLEVTESQLALITKESTGLSDGQVAKILSKDSFYTAEECYTSGFLPKANIIQFSKMPQFTESIQDNIQRIAAFYNNNNQNQSKMKKIAAHLKLNDEANENAILEKIQAQEAEKNTAVAELEKLQDTNNRNVSALQDAEKRIKTLEAKVTDFEDKEKAAKEKQAASEVEESIKKGVFKAESKDELTAIAVKDIDVFRKMRDSFVTEVKAPDVTAMLEVNPKNNLNELAAEYGVKPEEFNYDHLFKADKLKALEKNHPKVYKYLEAQYIKNNS